MSSRMLRVKVVLNDDATHDISIKPDLTDGPERDAVVAAADALAATMLDACAVPTAPGDDVPPAAVPFVDIVMSDAFDRRG